MQLRNIRSFSELQKNLTETENSFLLLYKSGSEQSDCALRNIRQLEDTTEISLLTADVNNVRDIHEKYQVNSVPTIVQFKKDKLVKTLKGCHEPNFFKSLFENSLYSSVNNTEDKKVKRVVVYTTPTCPHCTTLKKYLKDNRILFRDVDVSKDQQMAEQMVKKSGQQGVPQIEVNGRIVVGFNKPRIDELLEIR